MLIFNQNLLIFLTIIDFFLIPAHVNLPNLLLGCIRSSVHLIVLLISHKEIVPRSRPTEADRNQPKWTGISAFIFFVKDRFLNHWTYNFLPYMTPTRYEAPILSSQLCQQVTIQYKHPNFITWLSKRGRLIAKRNLTLTSHPTTYYSASVMHIDRSLTIN